MQPMAADQHKFWQLVGNQHSYLNRDVPKDHETVVQVFLAHIDEPVVVTEVHVAADPDFDWVVLDSLDRDLETRRVTDRIVTVPVNEIVGVEVGFRRMEGLPVGFRLDLPDN